MIHSEKTLIVGRGISLISTRQFDRVGRVCSLHLLLSVARFSLIMKFLFLLAVTVAIFSDLCLSAITKRSGFDSGEPIDDSGKGAPILGK